MGPAGRQFLRDHYKTMASADIASALGVSIPTVERAKKEMNLRKRHEWTDEQRQFIADHCHLMKMTKIAEHLEITHSMVRHEIARQQRVKEKSEQPLA